MLETGTKAPEFTLSDQRGNIVSLSDFRGSKVILYFYPKDNTPGCSRQACAFAQNHAAFQEKKAIYNIFIPQFLINALSLLLEEYRILLSIQSLSN